MKSLLFIPIFTLSAFGASAQQCTRFFYFNTNEYELAPNQINSLQEWLSSIADSAIIDITGFTDTVGSTQYNETLGYKRAEAIKTIIDQYKSGVIINYETKGETLAQSIELNKDRRVELNVTSTELDCNTESQPGKIHLKNNPAYFTDKKTLENGVFIKYNADYTEINDVKTGVNEEEMIENEFYAFDDNNNALITGGMVDIEFNSETGDTVEINIPAERYDGDMRLYIGYTDENGNLRWKEDTIPLQYDSVANAYAIQRNASGAVNVDKPGQVIYTFNFAKPNIRVAKVNNRKLSFAGISNSADIIFTSSNKLKLRKNALRVSHTNDKGRTKTYRAKIWHFKRKKVDNNYYFTVRKWFKKKYDFV
ncbi:MAG: OmpA family protein [Bacteroidia bacterium]